MCGHSLFRCCYRWQTSAQTWLRGAKVEHVTVYDLTWDLGEPVFLLYVLICLKNLAVQDENVDRIKMRSS